MTVSNQEVRNSYTANGVQTVWDYTFPIVDSTDVHVYVRDLDGVETEITTNFTIDTVNAQVTYPSVASLLSPLASGYTITLIREEPLTQEYTGAVTATVLESSLDKVTMILQEHAEKLTRCIQFQVNQTPTTEEVEALLAAATAAAASATAAAAAAAGLSLPTLSAGDVGKVLQVNAAHTGYQTATMLTSPLTTNGDLIYAVATTATRLAAGTANQVLHSGAVPSWSAVVEADMTLADNTTNNVLSTKHGFAPKSAADATKFLNSAATPAWAQVKDSDLSLSDITTNNVSTTKHGFAPKGVNDPTKFLDSTGAWSVPVLVGTGRLLRVTVFTASGTWTKGSGTRSILVQAVGGGGGGGGSQTGNEAAGAGGGGGGYAMRYYSSPGTTETVTIGAAGAVGSGGGGATAGGNGGDTTLGSSIVVGHGGTGGNQVDSADTYSAGGAGGTGANGDLNITGQTGGDALYSSTAQQGWCGAGGDSGGGFGTGGSRIRNGNAGRAGTGYGAGGGGGYGASKNGGAGTAGLIIVWEYA